MSRLALTPRFRRAFRRLVKKNPALQPQIEQALRRMVDNLNDPKLKTHHLTANSPDSSPARVAAIAGLFLEKRNDFRMMMKF